MIPANIPALEFEVCLVNWSFVRLIDPAHSYSQVLAHNNSAGHFSSLTSVKTNGGADISVPIQSIPTYEKSNVSNTVTSILIATVKNSEEPGTFETVLNSLLTANGHPTFKMGNVTPPTSFHLPQLTPHL